jgi:hypothetical protein
MLLLPTIVVKKSPVHGKGLFTTRNITKGHLLWVYGACDRKILPGRATNSQLHFGYVSSTDGMLVICGDISRWWNFGTPPNCKELNMYANGEKVVVASRNIMEGEELLISVNSDMDARRKLMV